LEVTVKRSLIILLISVLLLTACAENVPETDTNTAEMSSSLQTNADTSADRESTSVPHTDADTVTESVTSVPPNSNESEPVPTVSENTTNTVSAPEESVSESSTDSKPTETEPMPGESASGTDTEPTETETEPSYTETPTPPPITEGITYINGILVVNKTYSLPADYNPEVNSEAHTALCTMFADAAKEGLSLWVKSGLRTYADQKWQYNVYVERDGKELADTYSARPGHSEHQTGLAFDLNSLYKSFGDTAEGKWLAANCHRYGFIIRYPAGKEHITGYMYEPWHVRYVGTEHATAMAESGQCLEEYLGITSVYSY
jgi:D-alanyl-D-alanine carboxypeptidase